ncbi:MAG: zinc-binding dehydrogenase [Elusimicrobiota bacterium]
MKALLASVLQDLPAPSAGPGELLICVEASGLSGGTSGKVSACGAGVRGFKKGDRVFASDGIDCGECHYCLRDCPSMCRGFGLSRLDPGPFAESVRVPVPLVERGAFRLPPKMNLLHATLAFPLALCLQDRRRLSLREGDCALVLGLGLVGVLHAKLLTADGVTVVAMDPDPGRVRLAQKHGVDQAYTGKDGNTEALIRGLSDERGADALILTSGNSQAVAQRLGWLRDGGVVSLLAEPASPPSIQLDLQEFQRRSLSSFGGLRPSRETLREALDLIASGGLDVSLFARDAFPLERHGEAVRRVLGNECLNAMILPRRASR